ncbi:MAG: DUF481 domain-containing protein [Polyangiaceae bacterium]
MTMRTPLSVSLTGAFFLITSAAAAQDEPAGLMKQDAATGGATDVATAGFEAPVAAEGEDKDTTEANLSAGALVTTGNARSLALTGAGKYRLRRAENQFSAALAANYARSASDPDSDTETTVENLQGKLRYDRFVSKNVAVFIAMSGRRDRFQGLDLRLNVDPGVAYYFIDEKAQQLWAEGGYDLQYDVRRDENIEAAAATGETLDKTETRHNGRLFAGYDNAVSESVSFNTGVEYLQDVQETKNWRLNWDVGLTSSIGKGFSIATTFSLKYDNNPLPDVEKTDTVTAVSLVYKLL